MTTGSDVIVEALAGEGVEICFANPGTTEMWFVKSLANSKRIRSILALHETVCAGACDGYARMRRRPALCLLHMGPGLANALSNLHNAKRARSPVLVLVGDMAAWHASSDAPLCMDIASLAKTVSASVIVPRSVAELKTAAEGAHQCARKYVEDPLTSRVASIIVAHDLTWEDVPQSVSATHFVSPQTADQAIDKSTKEFLNDCIAKINAMGRGKVAFLIGGLATLADDDAVVRIGKIAAKTGAVLYCENSFARVDRGEGRPQLRRLPYFPQDALQALRPFEMIITIDCRLPVAQFGYRQGPSSLIALDDNHVWQIDAGGQTPDAIQYLFNRLNADSVVPGENCSGIFASGKVPAPRPDGKLTAASLCAVIADLQPENAIIVDESITSGSQYWELSSACPPFTHLTLTGGAIGSGPALSIGAAIACPHRLIMNIQADGSGMYCPQALWTQAREKLNIITVICSNRSYAILKLEVAKQGIQQLSGTDLGELTDLTRPAIDWVHIAKGMGVFAVRAETVHDLTTHLTTALRSREKRPFLIEALL